MLRIAVGGIQIECCTFSPLSSFESDFQVSRGEDLFRIYPFLSGYPNIQVIPLLDAHAMPGGPVDGRFYQHFKQQFLESLNHHAPLDGLYLPLHGAMFVEGLEDAEGDLLTAVRDVVGTHCFLSASYDLHGNVSERVFKILDFISAYRTAPHVDWQATQQRALNVMLDCLAQKVRPHKAFIPVPILLPGEQTSTEWEPAQSLYQCIPQIIQTDQLLDASILIGYVWADEPRSTAAVLTYGMEPSKVNRGVEYLAQRFWDVRHQFQFGVTIGSVDECIHLAVAAAERPVVISDSGDNPTAGGAGDTPIVLERLLALGVKDALVVGIADHTAVTNCFEAGIGCTLTLELGGKLDSLHAQPLIVSASIISLHTSLWNLSPTGKEVNRIAVVDVYGIMVVLTERRTTFHRLVDFTSLDIDPRGYKIVVVKIGYLEPELKALAAKALLAFSPGAVNQDILHLPYTRIKRPLYPFDPRMDGLLVKA